MCIMTRIGTAAEDRKFQKSGVKIIILKCNLVQYNCIQNMTKSLNTIRRYLFAGIFILLLSFANGASADVTLNPGEVQLSVAGILLDVEGSASALDEISFSGSSFDIILNNNQSVTFSSADRRDFSFTSAADSYATLSCTATKSSLTFNGAGLGGPLTITITPESSTCTSASSDGGGRIFGPGEGGGFADYNFGPTPDVLFPTPIPQPIVTPTPIPTIPPQIIIPAIQPEKLPTTPILTPPTSPASPYEPTAPVYIPPQPELPPAEIPSSPTTETAPTGIFGFILLYWPWIIAALAIVTLFGILLFIALRE